MLGAARSAEAGGLLTTMGTSKASMKSPEPLAPTLGEPSALPPRVQAIEGDAGVGRAGSGLRVLKNAESGMMVLDSEGLIVSANPPACAVFGRGQGELNQCPATDFVPYLSEFIENDDSIQARHTKGRRPDGSEFPLELSVRPLAGNEGMRIATVRDLSEAQPSDDAGPSARGDLEFKVRIRTIELADKVRELNAARAHLRETLEELRHTQDGLIQSEKMAALGSLVAGVAHEINTPVGIGVTAASHLQERLSRIQESFATGAMRKADLEHFFGGCEEACSIILTNLCRAAQLVSSFKQVAVDQSSDDIRDFDISDYIGEILLSLKPRFKRRKVKVDVDCPKGLVLRSCPGALAQIVTNLVVNSLTHAYGEEEEGHIRMAVEDRGGSILLTYTDDGCGMDEKIASKIFDPFFTTRRGSGGSGLGMHLAYNLATQTLGGAIKCTSSPGEGTRFDLTFNKSVKD